MTDSEHYNRQTAQYSFVHVDNKGNWVALYQNEKEEILFVNGVNVSKTFKSKSKSVGARVLYNLRAYPGQGQVMCVYQNEESLVAPVNFFLFSFGESGLGSFKRLKHEPISYGDVSDTKFVKVYPTITPNYFVLQYESKQFQNSMFIIWNTKKDCEETNFTSRSKDCFINYVHCSKATLGILVFTKYSVNLDTCLPIPFFDIGEIGHVPYAEFGPLMNESMDILILNSKIAILNNFIDLHFIRAGDSPRHPIKMKYFLNRKSYISDMDRDIDQLRDVLSQFENDNIFYLGILLPDADGYSAFDKAIMKNSPRLIELMLNYLNKIEDFSIARHLKDKFDELFAMKTKSF